VQFACQSQILNAAKHCAKRQQRPAFPDEGKVKRMPQGKIRKVFHRIFIAAALLWITYLTAILPIQQRDKAEQSFAQDVAKCTHDFRSEPDAECMEQAMHMHQLRLEHWSAGGYFGHGGWISIAAVGLGFPLALYGIIAGSAMVAGKAKRFRQMGEAR
jgi:hypothetical protein